MKALSGRKSKRSWNDASFTRSETPSGSTASPISGFQRLGSRNRIPTFCRLHQTFKRPARLGTQPLRFSKRRSANERTTRLADFARRCVDDAEVTLGQ